MLMPTDFIVLKNVWAIFLTNDLDCCRYTEAMWMTLETQTTPGWRQLPLTSTMRLVTVWEKSNYNQVSIKPFTKHGKYAICL